MNKTYNTEIISVGTELLLGHVTNTDARDVSEQLSRIGINVRYHTVVGDNPQRLTDCVEIARNRADIIITTGGLGPTCDDLTKQILAKSFGLALVMNKAEEEGLYDYIKYSRNFTPNNYSQAMLPEGCTVFHNNCGTAPGCAFEKDGTLVIMLPGPPKECNAMFAESALPYLKKYSGGQIVSHSVRVFGMGESAVDQIFRDEMNAMTNPTMAPYAKECDCLVQITAKADTEAEAEAMCAPVIEHVKERLGEFVYGTDVECIEESVIGLLREKGLTFAAAESCTGGLIAKRMTDVPGASAVFRGGVVVYTNEVKMFLGVKPETLEKYTAVSRETAAELAENVREKLGSDYGLSVTGVAGPDSDGVHPVGTMFVGLATKDGTYVRSLRLGGRSDRSRIRTIAANHAFDMLRRYILGLPVEKT